MIDIYKSLDHHHHGIIILEIIKRGRCLQPIITSLHNNIITQSQEALCSGKNGCEAGPSDPYPLPFAILCKRHPLPYSHVRHNTGTIHVKFLKHFMMPSKD